MNFVGKGVVVLAGFVKQKIQLGKMLRSFGKGLRTRYGQRALICQA